MLVPKNDDRYGSLEFRAYPGGVDQLEGGGRTQRGGSASGCDTDLGLARPTRSSRNLQLALGLRAMPQFA